MIATKTLRHEGIIYVKNIYSCSFPRFSAYVKTVAQHSVVGKRILIGFEVFASVLKAPTSLLREAEASGINVFRTVPKAFGRKEKIIMSGF